MSNVTQAQDKERGEVRFTAYLQAFLGLIFLLFSVAGVEAYLRGQKSLHVAGMITVSFLFCGCVALLSAWQLYRHRPVAASLYAVSWAIIISGWFALNILTDSPIWLSLLVALMLVYSAIKQVVSLRRALQRSIGS